MPARSSTTSTRRPTGSTRTKGPTATRPSPTTNCTTIEKSAVAKVRVYNNWESIDKVHAAIGCYSVQDMARALADNCSNNKEGKEQAGGEVVEWRGSDEGWTKNPQWVDVVAPE